MLFTFSRRADSRRGAAGDPAAAPVPHARTVPYRSETEKPRIYIQWPFGRADYAHSQTPKKLHRICHDKVTRSGSRHQPTTKHNLQYRTVRAGTSTIINLAISTSDCGTSTRTIISLYVSDLPNVTKSTVLVRTRVFRRRLPVTDRQTDTRDVKSGGCTDNAERTTQDSLRKNHEIGQSPPAHPKA